MISTEDGLQSSLRGHRIKVGVPVEGGPGQTFGQLDSDIPGR